jgi:phospholipase/carboxylesterase
MMQTAAPSLAYINVEPSHQADACVIWLHGLGDSGEGFASVPPYLKLPENHRIRFIFPHAPFRAITINNGYQMRAWYDIKSMALEGRAPLDEVEASVIAVTELIEQQISAGIPSTRILIAGFSQGGVVALHLGLRFNKPLAGLVALSTYLCRPDLIPNQGSEENRQLAIFFAHGSSDDVVPYSAGEGAVKSLKSYGYKVDFHTYAIDHTVNLVELEEIGKFISRQLPTVTPAEK